MQSEPERIVQVTPTPAPSNNGTTRALFYIFLGLVIIGGVNWGFYSFDKNYDLVAFVFGFLGDNGYNMGSKAVYGLVGFSSLIVIGLALGANSAIFATN